MQLEGPTPQASTTDPCFLVFSDDWGEHPSSCQHIFGHIAKHHQVLWVNTIGMRKPSFTFTDAKKVYYKLRKMLFGDKKQAKGHKRQTELTKLTVLQPFMLPFSNITIIRRFNQFLVTNAVKKMLPTLTMSAPIFITTVPNACDYAGHCQEQKVVYYCVDDYGQWPGLEHKLVEEMEQNLMKKSNIFIATSQALYDKLICFGKPTHLLTHGVDLDLFSKTPTEEHVLLKNIPKPRVGYFGLFDERSDKNLLGELARSFPRVSFVITGKVETDISILKTRRNIFFTGSIPYRELPAMVKGWEVCILPYLVNDLTNSINPLKLKEYLATNKPVVASPLPEAKNFSNYLNVANSATEWENIINSLLNKKLINQNNHVSAVLKEESWPIKAGQFKEICLSFEPLAELLSSRIHDNSLK